MVLGENMIMWSSVVDAKQNLKCSAERLTRRLMTWCGSSKLKNLFIRSICLGGNVSSIRFQRWACGTIDVCVPTESELFVLDMQVLKQLKAHASLNENNRSRISKSLLDASNVLDLWIIEIHSQEEKHGKGLVSPKCD